MAQFTLKKFLLLVTFLDRAKLGNLIDHNPCLFCIDSQFKVLTPTDIDFELELKYEFQREKCGCNEEKS